VFNPWKNSTGIHELSLYLFVKTRKLFEYYILSYISSFLVTTYNQFGFKPQHATDMCIFLLKHSVWYYIRKDTPAFSVFLDASKELDRTNHNLLFTKRIEHNVRMCIVRLLMSWYRQQTIQVKWGINFSCPFTVNNEGTQEEVLSPYLLFTLVNSQIIWIKPDEWDALWEIWL